MHEHILILNDTRLRDETRHLRRNFSRVYLEPVGVARFINQPRSIQSLTWKYDIREPLLPSLI